MDTEMQRGMLPGAMALSAKFVPVVQRVTQKTLEAVKDFVADPKALTDKVLHLLCSPSCIKMEHALHSSPVLLHGFAISQRKSTSARHESQWRSLPQGVLAYCRGFGMSRGCWCRCRTKWRTWGNLRESMWRLTARSPRLAPAAAAPAVRVAQLPSCFALLLVSRSSSQYLPVSGAKTACKGEALCNTAEEPSNLRECHCQCCLTYSIEPAPGQRRGSFLPAGGMGGAHSDVRHRRAGGEVELTDQSIFAS